MTGPEVEWAPDEDAHLCVWCCGWCGEGFPTEEGVRVHIQATGHAITAEGLLDVYVQRVFLGATLRWRPDTTEGFRCEVRALGHDGERPWLGLVGAGAPRPVTARKDVPYYWWVTFDTFVEACFPGPGANEFATPDVSS